MRAFGGGKQGPPNIFWRCIALSCLVSAANQRYHMPRRLSLDQVNLPLQAISSVDNGMIWSLSSWVSECRQIRISSDGGNGELEKSERSVGRMYVSC
jgi:hypothetical protein